MAKPAKRQVSAKRRARLVDNARADLVAEHAAEIDQWRKKHQHVLSLLTKEQGCRYTVTLEHSSLLRELEKFRQQDQDEVKRLELKRASELSAAELAHREAIEQLKAAHELEIGVLKNKHALELGSAKIEIRRLGADVDRLRAGRDEARADSLRYNAERNGYIQELANLKAQRSKASVAACVSAPVFPRE